MDKFPSAAFKKFASEKDAWAFVKGAEASAAPEPCRGEPPPRLGSPKHSL